ncbi:uncharacterized protein LOC134225956 [Armigeres subalbatus]|uniref:uncharacterized protein LOC134225956 n=1 Tax=Armigeres subalbatus TaxID=124917 RepID=UPI002ED3E005
MNQGDRINDLPTEMLCKIFDYLSFEQQMMATAVCHRWRKILSSDWYIPRRRLCLCTCNLNGDSSLLERMKRYRAFTIKDSNKDEVEFLEPLRRFLFCSEVAAKIEDLRLELFSYSLSDLLGGKDELHLPKLERISYLSSIWVEEDDSVQCNVIAPKLKTVILEDSKQSGNPLIRSWNDQIESLSVRFINKMLLFTTIGNLSFKNLTSLTLLSQQGCLLFRETDFHASHLDIFRRLTYLKISDEKNVFYWIYKLIFREAKNLETLIINGRKMNEEAFNLINRLKKLKDLCLMVEIQRSQPVVRLSLPLLASLITYAGSLVPLGSVPSLRSISVRNYKQPWQPYRLSEEAIHCAIFVPHIHTLKLSKLVLDSVFARNICAITGLRALELMQVRMETKHLLKMFSLLKQMRRVRLEWCFLSEIITAYETYSTDSSSTDNDDDLSDNDDERKKKNKGVAKLDCLQLLKVQYPACRITSVHNREVRHLVRKQSIHQTFVLPQYWRPF